MTVAGSQLLRPTATTTLWTNSVDPVSPSAGTTSLYLSGVVPQLTAGAWIIARTSSALVAFKVVTASQGSRKVVSGTTFTLGPSSSPTTVTTPDVRAPITVITITPAWPSTLGTDPAAVTIEYGLQDVGALTTQLDARIATNAPLVLAPPVEAPPDNTQPGRFLVSDADGTSLEIAGGIDFVNRVLTPAQGSGLTAPLDPPVDVNANIGDFSRGETVPSETLGVGDASIASQSFTLKKKPLTYVSSPSTVDPNGVRSTLRVWVADVEWREVTSFVDIADDSAVYVVRQDDDDNSTVIFGDGVRGARLPSGASVVASYRFGAGAASPPPGGLTQLAKPVKGITSIANPVAAAGGADRQAASQVRTIAPRSALLFGRAVSILDVEALAAGQPGVQAVQARWAWDAAKQEPTIRVWYIGSASIASAVLQSLRAATAPSTPISVALATAIPVSLSVGVGVDPRFQDTLVKAAVISSLTAPGVGALVPEVIGIGTSVFRSRLLASILDVPGTTRVDSLLWQGSSFDDYGIAPGDGAWFQVTLTVNVTEDGNG